MRKTLILAAIAVLTGIGCNKGADVSAKTDATTGGAPATTGGAQEASMVDGFDLKGTYNATVGKSGAKDDPGEKFAEAMIAMLGLKLKIEDASAYKLSIMGFPIGGHYTVSGTAISMTPETISGMTIEEWKKAHPEDAKKMSEDQLKPMKGTVDSKDQSITIPGDKPGSTPLVFKKAVEEDESKLPSTVADTEKPFVAAYTGTVDLSKATFKDASEKDMAEMMMKDISLSLRQDNTFKMHMGLDLGGKWKVDGSNVVLTVGNVGGISSDGKNSSNDKPLVLTPSSDGKTLTGDSPENKGKLTFTRS